jgi:hypothetical protein
MAKLSDLQQSLGIKLLQLGASGVGKTYRALDIGLRYGNVCVLDFDRNLSRMVPHLTAIGKVDAVEFEVFYTPEDEKACTVNGVLDLRKLDSIRYANLKKYCTTVRALPVLPYQTLIVDTSTFLNDLIIEALQADPYFGNPSNMLKMFGELTTRMCQVVKELASLPCNFILNAHEQLNNNGQFEIIGKGRGSDYWEKTFAERHRIMSSPKSLVPRVKAAMSEGLVTGSPRFLDAEGFFKPEAIGMFDSIAFKKGA